MVCKMIVMSAGCAGKRMGIMIVEEEVEVAEKFPDNFHCVSCGGTRRDG